MFEHWIRIKDQIATNKSRFPLIHVIESPNRPRIRIQYWPSTMCSCQVVSLSGVSGKGFWAPHCGYRRYFSSQRRCKAAVLLCTGGGLLSLVNTCGEIGLCTPRVEAHPPRGVCEWRPPMGGRRPPPPGV